MKDLQRYSNIKDSKILQYERFFAEILQYIRIEDIAM
jgi:hypothetical protein